MKRLVKLLTIILLVFSLVVVRAEENETNETITNETIYKDSQVQLRDISDKHGDYFLVIEDDARLLTDSQIASLREKMAPLTEYGNIVFKTIDNNSSSTEMYAKSYYYSNFGNASGTILLIDMANRTITIMSDGWNYVIITDDKATIITDNIYRYASREDYYQCAFEAFSEMESLLSGGKIREPMRIISNAILSLVCGFFLCFLYIIGKSKIKTPKNSEILKNCDIDFKVNSINVSKAGTHKVYSPRSESSGSSSHGGGGFSGGGGHSGGGGGFSGGGGSHRF